MRVLVCGGRKYPGWPSVWKTLGELDHKLGPFSVVIHGDYGVVDKEAGRWAKVIGRRVLPFPPDWERYGPAAGPIRNQQMLDEGKPEAIIAFPGGPGTADMVRRAKKAGLPVYASPSSTKGDE